MVELRPIGVRCNIQCQYCYQNPQRDAGNFTKNTTSDRMKAAIIAEGEPFAMFGGEPLLVREHDLEELWSWGFDRFGYNAIQTNGTLITDEHVRMFKQYNVNVGISLDGPGELNDVRWHGTLSKTREATTKSEQEIRRLCREGRPPSLIVTLHRGNASKDKLPQLFTWIRELDGDWRPIDPTAFVGKRKRTRTRRLMRFRQPRTWRHSSASWSWRRACPC